MNENPKLILNPAVVNKLTNENQAVNYVKDRIEIMKQAIASQPPPPTNYFESSIYLSWHRKTMILYGQVIGALQALQAFSHINVPLFQQLKKEMLNELNKTMIKIQLGQQKVGGGDQ